jgi:hypothetical protein
MRNQEKCVKVRTQRDKQQPSFYDIGTDPSDRGARLSESLVTCTGLPWKGQPRGSLMGHGFVPGNLVYDAWNRPGLPCFAFPIVLQCLHLSLRGTLSDSA